MTDKEKGIALLYTIATSLEAFFLVAAALSEDSLIVFVLIMLAIIWGVIILASIFADDDNSIQEY